MSKMLFIRILPRLVFVINNKWGTIGHAVIKWLACLSAFDQLCLCLLSKALLYYVLVPEFTDTLDLFGG